MQCIKPCDMIWGGEYTIWLNHIRWGFNIFMGMETNVIATLPNYGKVGFVLRSGYELVTLMHLSFHGSQTLGLGSRWTCHSLGCLGFFLDQW